MIIIMDKNNNYNNNSNESKLGKKKGQNRIRISHPAGLSCPDDAEGRRAPCRRSRRGGGEGRRARRHKRRGGGGRGLRSKAASGRGSRRKSHDNREEGGASPPSGFLCLVLLHLVFGGKGETCEGSPGRWRAGGGS